MRQRDHFQKQTFLYPAEAECRILRWHVDVLRQMPAVLDSPPQQGWMQFAVHSMPSVLLLLPLSVEWPQSSSWLFSLLMVHAGYVCVAIIHWTLTGTTGSLRRVHDLFCIRIHTGPKLTVSSEGLLQGRVCTEIWRRGISLYLCHPVLFNNNNKNVS